ncbi:ribonuclease H-like domain-containing protein [Tanacetum coccineum]
MTIAEYLEYEKKVNENHISNTKSYPPTYFGKSMPTHDPIQEFAHYFDPNQPGTESDCDLEDMEEEKENTHQVFGAVARELKINMEDDVDISALTIEQYIALIPDDVKLGTVNPKIGDDVEFEINANFIRELRRKLFAGTDDKDAYEHVSTVLEIVDLFHFPGVSHDAIMLRVFPITLKGRALRWKDRLPAGSINTWDLLKKEFIWRYCHPFITANKLEEICNFKQERDETLYYAWERYNDLLYQCPPHDLNC